MLYVGLLFLQIDLFAYNTRNGSMKRRPLLLYLFPNSLFPNDKNACELHLERSSMILLYLTSSILLPENYPPLKDKETDEHEEEDLPRRRGPLSTIKRKIQSLRRRRKSSPAITTANRDAIRKRSDLIRSLSTSTFSLFEQEETEGIFIIFSRKRHKIKYSLHVIPQRKFGQSPTRLWLFDL